MSGKIGHNTPQNGLWSPDQDDCALSIQRPNVFWVFFAIYDGKHPKQVSWSISIKTVSINEG